MKATGIVRRIDNLGRVVIPKEIRRTMRIREGDPLLTTLTPIDRFCWAIHSLMQRLMQIKATATVCGGRWWRFSLQTQCAWSSI